MQVTFFPAIERPLIFNSSFSQATLSEVTPSTVDSGACTAAGGADSASLGGGRASSMSAASL
jgi:hypothetical protein